MRISIIVPSFNQGQYIGRTIESILNQADPDLELIVMDGGSTDSTLSVLDQYRDRIQVLVSEPDDGQTDALRKGYAKATGDFIGWQNSDDIYLPGCFRRFRDMLRWDLARGEAADVYFGNQCVIGPEDQVLYGKIFGPFRLSYLLYAGWNITNQSSFFSRSCIQKAGGFDIFLHYAMDYDLYVKLGNSGAKFKWDDCYWGGFRIHNSSKGSTLHETRDREYARLRRTYIAGYQDSVAWLRQFRFRRLTERTRRLIWLAGTGRIVRLLRHKYFPSNKMLSGPMARYYS